MSHPSNAQRPRKYMCLSVNQQRFALPLSDVKEVLGVTTITPVPNMPDYVEGLINLRGRIITTMNLAKRLRIAKSTSQVARRTVVICLVYETQFGLIVDDVTEVTAVTEDQLVTDVKNLKSSVEIGVEAAVRIPDRDLTLALNLNQIFSPLQGLVPEQKTEVEPKKVAA